MKCVETFPRPLMSFFSSFHFLHVFNHFHAVRSINDEVFCCVLVHRGRLSASLYFASFKNPFACVERWFCSRLFLAAFWDSLVRVSSYIIYISVKTQLFAFRSVWISHWNSRHDSNVQAAWRSRCHIFLSLDNWTLLFSIHCTTSYS